MNDSVDVVEVDFVTFEPEIYHPLPHEDEICLSSQSEHKYFHEYVESLTYMYKSIVKSMNGSSANQLGLCTESYNQFLYFETNPQKSFQKFLSEKLSFDYEEVDGYFNLHIYGPSYLKNMVESIKSRNVH